MQCALSSLLASQYFLSRDCVGFDYFYQMLDYGIAFAVFGAQIHI